MKDPDQLKEEMNCRLARCIFPDRCEQEGCVSVKEHASEYRDFLERDAMPAVRHILKMIDDGKPVAHVRIELHALLQRMARTV